MQSSRSYLVLDLANIGCDLAARYPLHDEFSRDSRLCTPDILSAEEELAVEVGDINGVHVDNVDVAEA